MTGEPYYFVSHSSADNGQIRPYLLQLIEAGIPLWIDKPRDPALSLDPGRLAGSLEIGRHWDESVIRALRGASGVIAFFSKRSLASAEALLEVGAAHAESIARPAEFQYIPAFLDDVIEKVDARTRRVQGFQLQSRISRERKMEELSALVRMCRSHIDLASQIHAHDRARRPAEDYVGAGYLDAKTPWFRADQTLNTNVDKVQIQSACAEVLRNKAIIYVSSDGSQIFTQERVREFGFDLITVDLSDEGIPRGAFYAHRPSEGSEQFPGIVWGPLGAALLSLEKSASAGITLDRRPLDRDYLLVKLRGAERVRSSSWSDVLAFVDKPTVVIPELGRTIGFPATRARFVLTCESLDELPVWVTRRLAQFHAWEATLAEVVGFVQQVVGVSTINNGVAELAQFYIHLRGVLPPHEKPTLIQLYDYAVWSTRAEIDLSYGLRKQADKALPGVALLARQERLVPWLKWRFVAMFGGGQQS